MPGSADFWRLRIGIGRPPDKSQVVDFVLEQFTQSELAAVTKTLDRLGEKSDLPAALTDQAALSTLLNATMAPSGSVSSSAASAAADRPKKEKKVKSEKKGAASDGGSTGGEQLIKGGGGGEQGEGGGGCAAWCGEVAVVGLEEPGDGAAGVLRARVKGLQVVRRRCSSCCFVVCALTPYGCIELVFTQLSPIQ